jgi:hypothetical protein
MESGVQDEWRCRGWQLLFKTQMSPPSQSVMEVRQLALDLEEQSRINREQMKGGRHYKIKDRAANGIMSNLPVHLRIDEGLGDSCKTELAVPMVHPFFLGQGPSGSSKKTSSDQAFYSRQNAW